MRFLSPTQRQYHVVAPSSDATTTLVSHDLVAGELGATTDICLPHGSDYPQIYGATSHAISCSGPKRSSAISSTEQRGRTQWPMTRNLISETGPSQHHPLGYLHTRLPHIHGQNSEEFAYIQSQHLFIYYTLLSLITNVNEGLFCYRSLSV